MRKALFNAVVEALSVLKDTNGYPLFNWIDYDLGQFNRQEHLEVFPAALINLGRIQTTSYNDDTQLAEVTLSIDVYQYAWGGSWHMADDRTETLYALDLLDAVYVAIDGLYIDDVSHVPFVRVGEERIKTIAGLWAHRMMFNGTLIDRAAVQETLTIPKPQPTWD